MVVVDGRYTGEVDFYAYGEGKVVAIRELAEQRGYDLASSYGPTATRSPTGRCCEAVGHPMAVNPDKALRRHATRRAGDCGASARPVRVRRCPRPRPAPPALAAGWPERWPAALVGAADRPRRGGPDGPASGVTSVTTSA